MAYDLLNLDGEVFRYEIETQAGSDGMQKADKHIPMYASFNRVA